ncbi:MAG: hypothetical protein R3338_14695, partial [Thermoanaerobaculia bacterium]|nr:hypothetical protein [Thermoanaerobaculia bacterium]
MLIILSVFSFSLGVDAQWKIETDDGATLKFGFLVQARGEFLDLESDTAENLFFRRLRLLAGGTLTDRLSFFFETDSPNLGKGSASGSKGSSDIYIQDFVLIYKWSPDQYLDAGMLLNAISHNSNQSAASLLAVDYGPYSFLASAPTTSRVGRDYGLRARGYVLDDRLEYRASILQGARGTNSSNDFRLLGRLVYNVFEPEKGLFYGGTYLGKKRVLSFGASVDHQEDYQSTALDLFSDTPLANGDSVTFQADWIEYDGDTFLTELPEQDALLVEAGYYFSDSKLL